MRLTTGVMPNAGTAASDLRIVASGRQNAKILGGDRAGSLLQQAMDD
jgi:hypothetical protein